MNLQFCRATGSVVNLEDDKHRQNQGDESEEPRLDCRQRKSGLCACAAVIDSMPAGDGQRAAQRNFEGNDQVSGVCLQRCYMCQHRAGLNVVSTTRCQEQMKGFIKDLTQELVLRVVLPAPTFLQEQHRQMLRDSAIEDIHGLSS